MCLGQWWRAGWTQPLLSPPGRLLAGAGVLTVSAMEPSTCLSTHSYLGSGDTCCPPHPTPHLCFRPTSQVSGVWLCPTARPCQDLQPGARLSPGALSSATSVSVLALGRFIWEDQFPCCPEREGCVGLLPVAEGWVGIASGLTQALPAGPSLGPVSLRRQALRPGPCGSPPRPPPPTCPLTLVLGVSFHVRLPNFPLAMETFATDGGSPSYGTWNAPQFPPLGRKPCGGP